MRTSLYSIVCIVVRLGALIWVIHTLEACAIVIAGLNPDTGTAATKAIMGVTVAQFAIAALLWIYPGLLARPATGLSSRETFESPIDAAGLQHIAFAVLGTVIALSAFMDVVSHLVIAFASGHPAQLHVSSLVISIIKFAVGMLLAMKARGWSEFLSGARRRGRSDSSPPIGRGDE